VLLGKRQLKKLAYLYRSQGKKSCRHSRNVEKEHRKATRVGVRVRFADRTWTKRRGKRRGKKNRVEE
jgi:hypothetical protein